VPLLVIGGGSNLLLTADIRRWCCAWPPVAFGCSATTAARRDRSRSRRAVASVRAAHAGAGFSGLENLSLIPGTVGAAPMQNIGAYGVEIKDVFAGLTALDRQTGELRDFSLEECNFAYRDSLFKQQPGRWLILRVRFA
jgi:UDP-N-acetylmuramate dehydrogenase